MSGLLGVMLIHGLDLTWWWYVLLVPAWIAHTAFFFAMKNETETAEKKIAAIYKAFEDAMRRRRAG